MRIPRAFCLVLPLVGCLVSNVVEACTGISVRTTDGTAICARTMEFAADLQSNVLIIPRGKSYVGTLTQGRQGLRWTSKYGAVGANTMGLELLVDGVNERGLACGIFYHPGYASFPAVTDENASRSIASWEFVTWALTNCASVAEVVEGLEAIELCEVVQPSMGIAPPMHFIVRDPSGACQVIEYIRGQRKTYDNPLGVITNAPTFDWHMTNLHNYVELSRLNAAPIELGGIKLQPLSQGSGLVGLPGDFTSP
ncbi:MAG TPA: linear amide C-N hydrolase, partial [Pirellulales bacterium]|nr:linear amide C-N hydrolase [Pirellulales bacterium]